MIIFIIRDYYSVTKYWTLTSIQMPKEMGTKDHNQTVNESWSFAAIQKAHEANHDYGLIVYGHTNVEGICAITMKRLTGA